MKYQVGDKVRILSKDYWSSGMSPYCGIDNSAKLIGTTATVWKVGELRYSLKNGKDAYIGQFEEHEVQILTAQKGTTMPHKRTFRLLKNMPGVRKGTLFQEECEDGTQPYSAIESFSRTTVKYENRELVEDNEDWFVEVFKVEPEFWTREELDSLEEWRRNSKKVKSARQKFLDNSVTLKPKDDRGAKISAQWTPERRKAQARRMRKMHKQGKFKKEQ